MDLLLTHGYFLNEDVKELQIMKPYPTLGLLYVCSHLRHRGMDVEVFDSTFSTRKDLVSVLQQGSPSILGVYANQGTRPNVVSILNAAKDAGWQTVVGGPEPAAYLDEYLDAGADVVVIGEGESTLEELVPILRAGSWEELHQVRGVAFRSADGSIVRTLPRGQIENLDAQPWPSREAIDMSQYINVWQKHHGMTSVSLTTTRGCPYRCRWCSHTQVFGNTHRKRSPLLVADELEWLARQYDPDLIFMADDVFPIHPGFLYEYAAELQRRGLRIPFECTSRADRISPKVADTLAEMGCFRVWIGSESGSQRILDAMERGITLDQVRRAVDLCRSRGIPCGIFLMWGYDGEEIEDIEATIQHIKECDPDVFLTTVAYPLKGTPYFSQVARDIANPKPWRESTGREVSIKGRHSRGFYKFADQLIRTEVQLEKLRNIPNRDVCAVAVDELQSKVAEFRASMLASAHEVEA